MPVNIQVTCDPSPHLLKFILELYDRKPSEVTGEGRSEWIQKNNADLKSIEARIEQIAQIAFQEGRTFQKEHPNLER